MLKYESFGSIPNRGYNDRIPYSIFIIQYSTFDIQKTQVLIQIKHKLGDKTFIFSIKTDSMGALVIRVFI